MVPEFVHHRVVHLLNHFFRSLAETENRAAIDGNPWWWLTARPEERIVCQRLALIEAQQIILLIQLQISQDVLGRLFFYNDGNGLHELGVGRREIRDSLLD